IMTEELARIGAPHLPAQGLNHIGPILMEFGTAAQKAQHLPQIIAGTVIWAQGYSEPGACSDLASLATRASLVHVPEKWARRCRVQRGVLRRCRRAGRTPGRKAA